MSKEWFIKEGGQVCLKADNGELNGWDTQSLIDCLNGKEIKIADLEAKLAESEKSLKCTIDHYEKYCAELNSQNVMLYASAFNYKQHNQAKISFAVEQLEKAKSFCISAEDNGWCVTHKDWLDIVEYIDNQIKEIKGEK